MTPEEALAATLDSDIAVAHGMCVDEECTIKTAPDRPAASILWTLANVHGYSLVPTADLDRLRAAPLDVQVLAEAMHIVGICHDNRAPGATAHGLDWAAKLAHRYGVLMDRARAALGDRAAKEGRDA